MAETTISNSSTSKQTLTAGSGTNTLTITSTGSLKPTGPAITFTLGSGVGPQTVNNSGTIQPSSGRAFDVTGSASSSSTNIFINNKSTGVITAVSDVFRTDSKSLGTSGGVTLDNAGTITALSGRGFNIQEYASLTVTNRAGATIQATDDVFRITSQSTTLPAFTRSVSIDNSGTIKSTGNNVANGSNVGQALDLNDVNATTFGSVIVTNRAGGLIEAADADAIRGSRNALIDNAGTIRSNNYNSTSSGNDAIDFQDNTGGQVANRTGGQIIGARHGITGNNPVSVTNDGAITGSLGGGINLDTVSTTTTSITNSTNGVITGNAGNRNGAGVDGDGIDVDGLVDIRNFGTIRSLGHATQNEEGGTTVPANEALAIGGGSVVNYVGGIIRSSERGITVDNSDGGSAYAAVSITNGGTITGDGGQAINIIGTFADTIVNTGTINGSIATGGGADSITNSGTINGALAAGDGNDAIIFNGGAITSIDGGVGTDGITVNNASAAVTLAGVTNVETLAVTSGTATIASVQTYSGGISIGAGTLAFAAATSAATPSITFGAGAGTLTLNQAAFTGGDFATQIKGLGTEDRIDVKGLGTNATVTLGANNVLTVTNGTTTETIHLDPTQNLSAYRFHTASDGNGGTYVTYADDIAPVAAGASVSTDEDVAVAGTVGGTDADGDTLAYAIGTGPQHGSLSFNPNGSYTYTPDQDFNGSDSFTFTANDGTKTSAAATVSLAVASVNDVPVLSAAQATLPHGTEDIAYTITTAQLTQGYTDADGDTLGVSGLGATSGTVTDNGDGTFTIAPVADASGPVSLSYTVTDGHGGTAAGALDYVIDAVNDAPSALAISGHSVAENSADGTVIGTFTTTDVDDTSGFTYTLVDDAGGAFALGDTDGVLSVADGSLLDYEAATAKGIDVRVTDAAGGSYLQHFTIDVTDVAEQRTYAGTNGADTFNAPTNENWVVTALNGADKITTAGGNDTINGGQGNDTLSSGGGDDLFLVDISGGFDRIDGGAGYDRIVATTKTVIGLFSVSGIEEINGGGFAGVTISGNTTADTLDFSGTTLVGISAINGGGGNDFITGSAGDDTIIGGIGKDVLHGGGGDDSFLYAPQASIDAVDGGEGFDRILATAGNVALSFSSLTGIEEISGNGFANVRLMGSAAIDTLDFSGINLTGIDSIQGLAGADRITGGTGADRIIGGAGADVLAGGDGADIFAYTALTDSGATAAKADHIADFVSGTDKIDLSAIDASKTMAGNQAFTFVGEDAFTGVGQARIGTEGGHDALFVNMSGNSNPEFVIIFDTPVHLQASDLIL